MIQIADTQFGCASGNATCYCFDPNFGYGLRDCSTEACGDAVYSQILAWGTSVCAGMSCHLPLLQLSRSNLIYLAAGITGTAAITSGGTSSLASASPASVTATSTFLNATTPSATNTAPSVPDTKNASSSSGLSKGAKIGIGIGVSLGVVVLVLLLLLFRRHRTQNSLHQSKPGESLEHGSLVAEKQAVHAVPELLGSPGTVPPRSRLPELHGDATRVKPSPSETKL
jgi:hypothetical protein